VIRYMITDGSAARDSAAWLQNILVHIGRGVDFIQIREPELNSRELLAMAKRICGDRGGAKVLINDRVDIAIAAEADGVHLRDGSVAPEKIRRITTRHLVISVACHDLATLNRAAQEGADYILLAPVFAPLSKSASVPPLGLDKLREAAGSVAVPVIALGGVTELNARACFEAGAAGVAGISLFAPVRRS
jgi:thiamine-phosphate pyrophosphorylase